MTYNQYYNIISFTYLFLSTNTEYHFPNYYLEKAKKYLGDIEINEVKLNKQYLEQYKSNNKIVHSILNYLNSIKYNLNAENIIKCYKKEIGNINKIPDIQRRGLHPLLYEMINKHLKEEEKIILKLKRKTILNKLIIQNENTD